VNLQPLTVARVGIYVALAVAALSGWLGLRAGASLDFALLRGVVVFVIFAALGFGAEAILTVDWHPPAPAEGDRGAPTDEQA
jgi:hypothetical protein